MFKIGDTVIVVKEHNPFLKEFIGHVGVIKEIFGEDDHLVSIKFEPLDQSILFTVDQIELVTEKDE